MSPYSFKRTIYHIYHYIRVTLCKIRMYIQSDFFLNTFTSLLTRKDVFETHVGNFTISS